jgi:hypothetical protein
VLGEFILNFVFISHYSNSPWPRPDLKYLSPTRLLYLQYYSDHKTFHEIRAPGPDLACNAEAGLPGLINIIDIAIFAGEVTPGQAGRANTPFN